MLTIDDILVELENIEQKLSSSSQISSLEAKTCTICLEDFDKQGGGSLIRLKRCFHSYHHSCFQDYLNSQMRGQIFPICCPQCQSSTEQSKDLVKEIGFSDIKEAFGNDPSQIARIGNYYLAILPKGRPQEFACCFSPDCPGIRKKQTHEKVYFCGNCTKRYCTSCNVLFHEDMTCEEYQSKIRLDSENAQSEDCIKSLISSGEYKKCPNCTIPYSKIDGCNLVTCGYCKQQICWQTGLLRTQCGGGHNCH